MANSRKKMPEIISYESPSDKSIMWIEDVKVDFLVTLDRPEHFKDIVSRFQGISIENLKSLHDHEWADFLR